ncbi:hypothetical protein E2C01_017759 [Portunus trituberculatus]|uniref:HAT C-terminal dimerisation domain-containing protein n=1 Tax=Portunus trituberculatus TaxID=210409 RepID=A0A5B7DST8_PORTR|nr:hypothetical protein [Portunus trituberculatus]
MELINMKDTKTYVDARDLLTSVCDLQIIIGLEVLKEDSLKAEQSTYQNVETDFLPKTASKIVKFLVSNFLSSTLPHFSTAAKILATIPATSCSAERLFSCLRRHESIIPAINNGTGKTI